MPHVAVQYWGWLTAWQQWSSLFLRIPLWCCVKINTKNLWPLPALRGTKKYIPNVCIILRYKPFVVGFAFYLQSVALYSKCKHFLHLENNANAKLPMSQKASQIWLEHASGRMQEVRLVWNPQWVKSGGSKPAGKKDLPGFSVMQKKLYKVTVGLNNQPVCMEIRHRDFSYSS